jgi:hypothetical protein
VHPAEVPYGDRTGTLPTEAHGLADVRRTRLEIE